MSTNYTALLGFALPTTGELDGTWGTVVNDSITQLVEDSVAGTATQSVTSGNWTLTTTGSGAANQARCAILIPTGSPGVSRNIIAPSQSKAYIVINQSDGAVVLKGSATTGATISAGAKALIAWNGSDFVNVVEAGGVTSVSGTGTVNGLTLTGTVTSTGSLTLGGTLSNVSLTSAVTGTLPVANGGTGLTALGTGVASALGQNVSGSGSIALNNSPSFTTPAIGTPSSGTLSNCTVDGTDSVGFRNTPINSRSADYTLVLSDAGKTIYHPASDVNPRTFTIPSNGSVNYAIGTVVSFVNLSSSNVTIAITSDTMYLAGPGTTGSRTLAAYGMASAMKVASTTWIISGNNLT